ncbi:MAG: histidine kinase, partial [Acidobacteria bacterium]|nr:histidine kinase [Acidobacteriota bacterium]
RDGRLLFPTQGGLAVVDPELTGPKVQPPPVVIESLMVDRRPMRFGDRLEISPGQENLEIQYTGLSFIKPDFIRFKYRLEGLDQDWVEAGTRRAAYYSHLAPGDYTFTVTAANSEGVWNTQGASLRIIVHPPFWRTWWFLSLTAAVIAGLAFLAYELRVLRLKRAHAAQEAFSRQLIASQEQERKRIAAELHDGLGQNLLIIKNRALMGLHVLKGQETAREQLDEITSATSQAIEEVREIAYNLRPYHLDRLGLTSTIEAMIEKIAATSEINFSAEIDNLDGLLAKESEINLYRVIQESLNNIVKHSGAAAAQVKIMRDESGISITIRDDGRGFLLEPMSPAESRRRGFGLTGMAERVRMLGGTHTIHSAPGEGTTVSIRINLPRERSNGQDGN